MWLVDETGRPRYYDSIKTYLEDWCIHRLGVYKLRKKYWLGRLKFEKDVAQEKARYMKQLLADEIIPKGKKSSQLIEELLEKGYKMCNTKLFKWKPDDDEEDEDDEENEEDDEENEEDDEENEEDDEEKKVKTKKWNMDYLSNMKIWSLTDDKIEEIENEVEKKKLEYMKLKQKKIDKMWYEELIEFENNYSTFLDIRNKSDGKKYTKKR